MYKYDHLKELILYSWNPKMKNYLDLSNLDFCETGQRLNFFKKRFYHKISFDVLRCLIFLKLCGENVTFKNVSSF